MSVVMCEETHRSDESREVISDSVYESLLVRAWPEGFQIRLVFSQLSTHPGPLRSRVWEAR